LIDTEKLRDERVMFSLTRHNIIRDGKKCTPLNLCTESYYRGGLSPPSSASFCCRVLKT